MMVHVIVEFAMSSSAVPEHEIHGCVEVTAPNVAIIRDNPGLEAYNFTKVKQRAMIS